MVIQSITARFTLETTSEKFHHSQFVATHHGLGQQNATRACIGRKRMCVCVRERVVTLRTRNLFSVLAFKSTAESQ